MARNVGLLETFLVSLWWERLHPLLPPSLGETQGMLARAGMTGDVLPFLSSELRDLCVHVSASGSRLLHGLV